MNTKYPLLSLLAFVFLSSFILIACENSPKTPNIQEEARTSIREVGDKPTGKEKPQSKAFVSEKGRFSINFPKEPKEHEHTTSSEIGQIKLTQFIYDKEGTQAWIVSYSDYPDKMIHLGNNSQLLKGVKYRILEDLRAKVTTEKEIKFADKYDGLSFVARADKRNLDILYNIYLVKNRVYQVSMYSTLGPFSAQDSTSFLGSFKLLNAENPS